MKVKQEVLDSAPEVEMGEANRLFLDISSTATGYCVASFSGRTCTISRFGVMWFPADVPNGQKYYQLQQAVGEFYTVNAVTDIIYESYHVNPNQVGNSLVVPEMIGAMKAACHDVFGMPISYQESSPTDWRGRLGIKPIKTPKIDKNGNQVLSGKSRRPAFDRDYKTPTKDLVNSIIPNAIPDKLISNITGNARSTPSDIYDAVAICLSWHKKFGCDQFILKDGALDGV